MSKPWFRCFPANFLAGTRGMRPILHKTYTRLLMGMYDFGGPLPMEARQLGHLLELRPQDVRALVNELVVAGKVEIKDGFIHNKRTDHEMSRWTPNDTSNGAVIEAPLEAHWKPIEAPLEAHSVEKPNGNYTHAHDHMGADAPAHARRAVQIPQEESGALGLHDGPRAAPPTSTVSATAPAKENGDNLRRRRTNDWDMPPAPGPIGKTPFLKKFAAAKNGDKTALDPLPGPPEKPKKETRQ
jgi:hypothetical protein